MRSIVGQWQLFVDWGNTGNQTSAGLFTFNANGSWTYQYGGGDWIQSGCIVSFNFSNASGLTYSGTINSLCVAGGMSYTGQSGDNSFYMIPEGTKASLEGQTRGSKDSAIG